MVIWSTDYFLEARGRDLLLFVVFVVVVLVFVVRVLVTRTVFVLLIRLGFFVAANFGTFCTEAVETFVVFTEKNSYKSR